MKFQKSVEVAERCIEVELTTFSNLTKNNEQDSCELEANTTLKIDVRHELVTRKLFDLLLS